MTNAAIDNMLTIVTRTVNTLKVVASDIDELLKCCHTFTVKRSGWFIEYRWRKANSGIELHMVIDRALIVRVGFMHPLLSELHEFSTTLDAPDLNQSLLLLVGQCCHKPIGLCPFCGS